MKLQLCGRLHQRIWEFSTYQQALLPLPYSFSHNLLGGIAVDTMITTEAAVAFRCDTQAFADHFAVAFRAAPVKSTLVAQTGVLLIADAAKRAVSLTATDGVLTITTSLPADIHAAGEIVLHRIFGDVVRSLPPGVVELHVDAAGDALVTSGRSRFQLRCYPRGDYPRIPPIPEILVEVPAKDFARAIGQSAIAASTDQGRPILMAVSIRADAQGIHLVATDTYRLTLRDLQPTGFLADGESLLLPARCLVELAKLVTTRRDETIVEVGIDSRCVTFRIGDTAITATLIEGEFPTYQQIIPDHYPNRVEFNKASMLDALRRVSLLARDSTPVRMDLSQEGILLHVRDSELGCEAREDLDAIYVGSEMTIGFNATYLRDGIEGCVGERIQVEISEPLKPAMLSSPEEPEFRYLLMPIRI